MELKLMMESGFPPCLSVGGILEQFNVAHDQLFPVDKDHGHLLLSQQFRLQQRLLERLKANHKYW